MILLQALLAALGLTAIALGLAIAGSDATRRSVTLIVACSYIAYAMTAALNAFFRAHQLMAYEALVRLVFSVLRTALLITVLVLGYPLITFVVAELVAYVAALALNAVLLRRRVTGPAFGFDPPAWRRLVTTLLPFVAMNGLIAVYVGIDVVLLSLLAGDAATGWYAAAAKFFFLFSFLPKSVIAAVMPVMARQGGQKGGTGDLATTFGRTFRFLIMLGLPIAVGAAALAEPIIELFYGEGFAPAAPALQILMGALLFGFANWACDSALIALNRERALLAIVFIGAAFNIAANLIAIPRWGHIGASLTTLLSEGLILLIKLGLLRKAFSGLALSRGLGKPLLGALLMVALLLLLRELPPLILVAPAAAAYLGSLLLLRAFSAEEVTLIRTVLPPRLRQQLGEIAAPGKPSVD